MVLRPNLLSVKISFPGGAAYILLRFHDKNLRDEHNGNDSETWSKSSEYRGRAL